jgi:HEAT repeat protein
VRPLRPDGGSRPPDLPTLLETEWLFELTYRADGTDRTRLVTRHPAPLPENEAPTVPPRVAFDALGRDDRYRVTAQQIRELDPIPFDRVPEARIEPALSVLRDVIEADPTAVDLPTVETALTAANALDPVPEDALFIALIALRDRDGGFDAVGDEALALLQTADHDVGRGILQGFIEQAQSNPEQVAAYVSDLASLAADSAYREGAVRCLTALAETDATRSLDAVPALATAVESDEPATRQWAVYALSLVADDHPDAVFPTVDTLIEVIRTGGESTRSNALSALGHITSSYPDAAAPVAATLVDLLDDTDPAVRNNAVGLLADIAREHPAAVISYADPIAGLLADSNTQARVNASIALQRAGEANPAAIRAQHERIEAALTDANATVRANACGLVANAGFPVSIETLRDLRESDPDETVREQAARALERLS